MRSCNSADSFIARQAIDDKGIFTQKLPAGSAGYVLFAVNI
jgi:hypothetical protein